MLQQLREPKDSSVSVKKALVCCQCADALALYHEFIEKGLVVREPFVGNNLGVVALRGPDGYRLDFESPTDVSEETTSLSWKKISSERIKTQAVHRQIFVAQ